MQDRARFLDAVARIDAENARDPRVANVDGEQVPFEVAYARRLTAWVTRLAPDASEELLLAARGQHIGRWRIPRDRHPDGLHGYLQWREDLKAFHAKTVGGILADCGYDAATTARVLALVTKEKFPDDPESRVLEDALCLVFIETQLADFAASKPREKTIDIVRKTWEKMTPKARSLAAGLNLPPAVRALIEEAGAGG
jgi:hypothetical protein